MHGFKYNMCLASTGKYVTSPPRFVDVRALDPSQDLFHSVYRVTEDSAQAVVEAGTTAGFKGAVWSERLWVDVDTLEGADRTQARLDELRLGYEAYFTGGRGGHFSIARVAAPSHLLPLADKAWVKEHLPEADLSLYSHLHLIRTTGSTHESGRKKVLLSSREGLTLTLPPYQPPKASLPTPLVEGRPSVFECNRVFQNSGPAAPGDRHHQLVRLTYALRDDAKLSQSEALWWVGEVNAVFDEPKTSEEVDRIVSSLYSDSRN